MSAQDRRSSRNPFHVCVGLLRSNTLAAAQNDSAARSRPAPRSVLAMSEHGLFRPQIDRDELRRFIRLLTVAWVRFAIHSDSPLVVSRHRLSDSHNSRIPPLPRLHCSGSAEYAAAPPNSPHRFPCSQSAAPIPARLVLPPPAAELAFPMRRNLSSNCCRPQMGHLTKKLHRALPISVFQLAIRRAHPAQRLDAALDALRDPRTLAISQLQQRILPHCLDPSLRER